MNFIHQDLGTRSRGDVVEVTLDRGANVRLLDSSNFQKYRRTQKHHYRGGLAKQSPVRLKIPSSGHWHVVIDLQGLQPATVRTGVRVIPASALKPLPPISQKTPALREIADNLAEVAEVAGSEDEREFDVFISHASEDKEDLVRPLAEALTAQGLAVWFDEAQLRIGDSLRRGIDAGIARSRFGLVVLSPAFFAKGWTAYELDGLVTMSVDRRQVLLPVWHGVSKDEVISHSPSLADKIALRTADYGIGEIAEEIAAVINGGP